MKILVLNCGSSSIKFQLVDMTDEKVLMKGVYERVGTPQAFLTVKVDGEKIKLEESALNHIEGIEVIFKQLLNEKYGKLNSLEELDAIGHRVVHGGEKFASSVLITDEVKNAIEECAVLSPLHNPAGLNGIIACQKVAPNIPNVGVFDTAFHQTMDKKAYIYNIPYEYYEKYGIRKYGFHGTSHRYIAQRVKELVGDDKAKRIISCHIGQGASICAVKDGKSIETSMGLTPLAGIPMGTRSGDIDPSIITYIANKENLTLDEVDNILNKKSGVLGLSGISSDFRDVEQAASENNERAILALKSNVYQTAKFVSSYFAVLNGVDVIAFAGGVGENGKETRSALCEYLKYAGVEIDEKLNDVKGEERRISTPNSKIEVWIIPTNEEIMIARDAKDIVEKL
ncbi:MAG: acetate/propionate family kinase [Clostridium sp.]